MSRPTLDEPTITFFREALERHLDWMESEGGKRLTGAEAKGYLKALRILRYRTLGDEKGCVVTAFDRRQAGLDL